MKAFRFLLAFLFAFLATFAANAADLSGGDKERITHTVVQGEYLEMIAENYSAATGTKVTWPEIAKVNVLKDPDLIFPGQTLVIPAAATPEEDVPEITVVIPDWKPIDVEPLFVAGKPEFGRRLTFAGITVLEEPSVIILAIAEIKEFFAMIWEWLKSLIGMKAGPAATGKIVTSGAPPTGPPEKAMPPPAEPKVLSPPPASQRAAKAPREPRRGPFLWKEPGKDPCKIAPESAIDKLGYPESVAARLKEKVRAGDSTETAIVRGDRFEAMCFGKGRIARDVVADWKLGHEEPGKKYSVTEDGVEYAMILPRICSNAAKITRVLPLAREPSAQPAVPAAPTPPIVEKAKPAPPPEAQKPCQCPPLNIVLSLEPLSDEEAMEKAGKRDQIANAEGEIEKVFADHNRFNP